MVGRPSERRTFLGSILSSSSSCLLSQLDVAGSRTVNTG